MFKNITWGSLVFDWIAFYYYCYYIIIFIIMDSFFIIFFPALYLFMISVIYFV